ncbi:dipeptide/oligopeptide/nickel ABC transporter permease/ATP-binding protein [Herbiconiux ginsengi]|uniref:Peptide/nickel transport system permease protein n=1 Tax=Herbiconiux ginsengi TaxID=381665 RepID=A0A1H3TFT1_9MICO|nr:dipeptide/oligopeptide/nickel ABC transporter permease/ATP-binding protein [Herbiconiux ginsengi]SDZ48199.1 peptide/nickel transport system permease protein [Herbiconiux ginsengi]
MTATKSSRKESAAAEVSPHAAQSPRFLRRLLKRGLARVCLAYILLLVIVAIVAPMIWPEVLTERTGDLADVNQLPSLQHLLGTDSLGRDVFQRILVGAQITLIGVAQALAVALVLGVPLGLIAGYVGGRTDRVISWIADLLFALPGIIIILVVLAVFPLSMTAAMVTLGVLVAPGLARIVRSAVLPVKEELYVSAARVSGLGDAYIITQHVLPRVAGPIIVQASLISAAALISQTGLAFLGLIVEAPAPSWGGMIAEGLQNLLVDPWLIWPPGVAVTLTTLALGLLGDSVRDATTEGWAGSSTKAKKPRSRRAQEGLEVEPADRNALLRVEDVNVEFRRPDGRPVRVVDSVTFHVGRGETVGLVGESGCGKTATAMSIIGALPSGGYVESGRIVFDGVNLLDLDARIMRAYRGKEIAVISQEPSVSLNPGFRVGWQLAEVVRNHTGLSRRAAKARVLQLLQQVELRDPEQVLRRYPHELSGGMAQRVVIARALAGEPRLLIADEPTTALDVTIQAEILNLLRRLVAERGMSMILITHDWGVVADVCDRAIVMYAGEVVERGVIDELFAAPLHPYTKGLLASDPHRSIGEHRLISIAGSVPPPGSWPSGCHFRTRCAFAVEACAEGESPALRQVEVAHDVRCIRADELEDHNV